MLLYCITNCIFLFFLQYNIKMIISYISFRYGSYCRLSTDNSWLTAQPNKLNRNSILNYILDSSDKLNQIQNRGFQSV